MFASREERPPLVRVVAGYTSIRADNPVHSLELCVMLCKMCGIGYKNSCSLIWMAIEILWLGAGGEVPIRLKNFFNAIGLVFGNLDLDAEI